MQFIDFVIVIPALGGGHQAQRKKTIAERFIVRPVDQRFAITLENNAPVLPENLQLNFAVSLRPGARRMLLVPREPAQ